MILLMPELPDIEVYVACIAARVMATRLDRIRLASPFLLRTVSPTPEDVAGKIVQGVRRLGKRVVIELEGETFLVIHLMISGRLHWQKAGAKIPGKVGLAAFDFTGGSLVLTESSSKKRASLHLIRGRADLQALNPGGIEVLACNLATFRTALLFENHTLKRALTDPRLFSGIGNAYSDEILHHARLSPVTLTSRLGEDEIARLYASIREVLSDWTSRLRTEVGSGFPEKVTAFREEMAVHGRFGKPCPVCGDPVQRIVYAENEANYCATCQTGGKLLADRSLSRLLKGDWPRSLEELEERRVALTIDTT